MILSSHGLARLPDKLKPQYLHYHSAYSDQTWQDDNLFWWAPDCKVTWLFDHVVLRYYVTKQNHYISTIWVSMDTKLCRMVTYIDGLLPIKSFYHWEKVVLWDHVTNLNHYTSTATISVATALGIMVTYHEWLLPMKTHDHKITWSCKITWQTKSITYPLTQYLWLLIFARWGYMFRSFLP